MTDVKIDETLEPTMVAEDALDAVDEQLISQLADRARSEGLTCQHANRSVLVSAGDDSPRSRRM